MRSFWKDIYFGIRLLGKNPGFTAVAVFSLAVGIGLNATIFCIVDRLILRPLPVQNPDELVLITIQGEKGGSTTSLPYPEYLDLRNQCRTLSGIIGTQRHMAILSSGEMPELLPSEYVTRNYFSVLGVKAHLGRVFRDGDADLAEPVVVISYRLWQSRFGGDAGIAGKAIELTRKQVTVIGVAPRDFAGTQRPAAVTDVWYPVESAGSTLSGPRADDFDLLGRLPEGVPCERAQSEVGTIVRRLTPSNPAADKMVGADIAFEAREYRDRFGILGLILMVVAGLILLVACVNVSNLLLARSEQRRKEIAVRLALGGSRMRLMRQLLTESLVLSLAAAACGLLLARWAVRALPVLLPPMQFRILPELSPDVRVLGFCILLAFVTTAIFALVPALHASRLDLVTLLNESAMPGGSGHRFFSRKALVAGQLCISLVLLTQSGLLVQSFIRGLQADVGFQKKNMLLADFALGVYRFDEAQARIFCQTMLQRVQALPGVKQVSIARRIPLRSFGGGYSRQVFLAPGDQTGRNVKCNVVGLNYFQTMGARILRGRDFDVQDMATGTRAVLVSETFAGRFWPGEDAVGKIIRVGDPQGEPVSIVGVVRDGPINRIGEPAEPYLYLPFNRGFSGELTLLVETAGDPGALAGPLRQVVHSLDRSVGPFMIGTLKGIVREGLYESEIMATFMGAFGLLGLLLASFGLYGMVSYAVNQRTREIGLRMALGAQRRDALVMVLRQGLGMALLGTTAGIPLALATSYYMRSALYGVSPADPTALSGMTVLLVAVALLASYIPALRATRVDPMVALRNL